MHGQGESEGKLCYSKFSSIRIMKFSKIFKKPKFETQCWLNQILKSKYKKIISIDTQNVSKI